MKNFNRSLGESFENQAEIYLKSKGYKIIDKNFHFSHLEIDLIALDNDILVFIEVKGRYSSNFGTPCESVSNKKQTNIIKCAKYYIHKNNLYDRFVRFDIIEVYANNLNNSFSIEHIENAFICK
ncbi:MAG: YraN family protein [Clostridiaceae bacterium]